MSQSEYMKK